MLWHVLWYAALLALMAICIGGALSWLVVLRRARYFAQSNRRSRDSTAAGILRKETSKTGALSKFSSGGYAQMNGSAIGPLDRREALHAVVEALPKR